MTQKRYQELINGKHNGEKNFWSIKKRILIQKFTTIQILKVRNKIIADLIPNL
jgi:hypothetical protein